MQSTYTTALFPFMKAQIPAGKLASNNDANILSAHRYLSPRARRLTPEQAEVRQIAYDLKIPTPDACQIAARALARLLDTAEAPETPIILMPVPASTGSTEANTRFCTAIAAALQRRRPAREVEIKVTVTRKHPVESSCTRRRRGGRGLRADQHVIVSVDHTPPPPAAACYFVDNMATTGTTLYACRAALGYGRGLVWADKRKP